MTNQPEVQSAHAIVAGDRDADPSQRRGVARGFLATEPADAATGSVAVEPWSPNSSDLRAFLHAREGERIAISVLYGGGAHCRPFTLIDEQIDTAVAWVMSQTTDNRTVSAGVAQLTDAGYERLACAAKAGQRARPRAAEHAGYSFVAADLDPHEGEVDVPAFRDRLGKFPHPPSLLVHSGRGLHAWWRLTEVVSVDDGRQLMEDLARMFGADHGVTDPGRALRLPGTWNAKNGARRLAVLEQQTDRTYSLAELRDAARVTGPRRQATALPATSTREASADTGPFGSPTDLTGMLRAQHPLSDVLTQVSGAMRMNKWACFTGHDGTPSLGLHPDNADRWVCFGSGHPPEVGREVNGRYSGDVIDVLAYEAGQRPEEYLLAERRRLQPFLTAGRQRLTSVPNTQPECTQALPTEQDTPRGRKGEGRASQADMVRDLALSRYDIGRTSAGTAFVVPKSGPHVAKMLRGNKDSLRAELAREYSKQFGKVPSASALTDAMAVVEGHAAEAEPVELGLRVAQDRDDLVLDLGDSSGQVVTLTPEGWRVAEKSPVLFRRTGLTEPLPVPQRGGSLEEFRSVLNVTDAAWPLLVGWLVAAMFPDIPRPIALLTGEHGTGKSTAARMLSLLLDPSSAPLRSQPRDDHEWAVVASSSYVVAVDNISAIQPWYSDALCRAVTGDGRVARALYSDSDLSVLTFRRVMLLTAIDPGALRGDLADRILTVDLERIPTTERRRDSELKQVQAEQKPRVLGALLELVCQVMKILPEIRTSLRELPRMADFYEILVAVDQIRGTDSATTYLKTTDRLAEDVIAADPVANALRTFLEHSTSGSFEGPAGKLLELLPVPEPRPKAWPADATRLSGAIKRAAPALRGVGIVVDDYRTGRGRGLRLKLSEGHATTDPEKAMQLK